MIKEEKKIVVIGGGTGLSTMLRGLKKYTNEITAIVTVMDNGGGSGVLRQDLGMLPPGDIRNCVLALANTEPIMEQLLQYRFTEGMLKGQSFGNLFLAAMNGISSNFEEAVKRMSDVLAVSGRVLPVTLEDVVLNAELENGIIVSGEEQIAEMKLKHKSKIGRIFLEPELPKALNEALEAIRKADLILLGPGSLYTSIIPNLLADGICKALQKASGKKIYVSNIMTQPGETDGYSLGEHIKSIENHSCKGIIDCCIVNNGNIDTEIMERYRNDGAELVKYGCDNMDLMGIKIIEDDLVNVSNGMVRHNSDKLANIVFSI